MPTPLTEYTVTFEGTYLEAHDLRFVTESLCRQQSKPFRVCQTRGSREQTVTFPDNGLLGFITGRHRKRGMLVMEILLQNKERNKKRQVTAFC